MILGDEMTFLKRCIAIIKSLVNKRKHVNYTIVNKPNNRYDIFPKENEARLEHQ